MIATSHEMASAVGRDILRAGGNAMDAAIAAAFTLGVVEPHASGIGGGGFLVYHDGKTKQTVAFDGRATAPASARPDMFVSPETGFGSRPADGGRLVAVPGALAMLADAHAASGRLPWAELVEPAQHIAREGFPISEFLHRSIGEHRDLIGRANVTAIFFDEATEPRSAGERMRNPELADTLAVIGAEGIGAFYSGIVAYEIAEAVDVQGEAPGYLKAEDLLAYKPLRTPALCAPYRGYEICGPQPPSSAVTVLETLTLLDRFDIAAYEPMSEGALNLIAQAMRLAYVDRLQYLADPAFTEVPVEGLIHPGYAAYRARLINLAHNPGVPAPGRPFLGPSRKAKPGPVEPDPDIPSTTHISVMDEDGNAASLTLSLGRHFGSGIWVRGFLLNASMSDFSANPVLRNRPQANAIKAGKRPRSSMTPLIVRDGQGLALMALGSPGGTRMVSYALKTLIATIDWRLGLQEAIDLPNFSARGRPLEIEPSPLMNRIADDMRALRHKVERPAMQSGINAVALTADGFGGGADRRRGGVALGD